MQVHQTSIQACGCLALIFIDALAFPMRPVCVSTGSSAMESCRYAPHVLGNEESRHPSAAVPDGKRFDYPKMDGMARNIQEYHDDQLNPRF